MRNFIKKSAAIIVTAVFATSFGITASAAPAETTAEADTEVTTTSISTVITEDTETTTPPVTTSVTSATSATTTNVTTSASTTTVATTTVNTEETSSDEDEAKSEYMFIPDIEVNVSDEIDLSALVINNVNVTLDDDMKLSELLATTGLKHCTYGSMSVLRNEFTFISGMFGIQYDVTDILSFEGTLISIEVMDENKNIVSSASLDKNKFHTYTVVGISSSDFWTHDDFTVSYYGGLKSGTTKKDMISILGEGTIYDDKVVYKNSKHSLVIELDNDVIDEIILLNNFDLSKSTLSELAEEELPKWYETPYEDGMLADEDLYNYVLDYIGGDSIDTQGSGVLIGEDVINEQKKDGYEVVPKEESVTSGEKVMYSVATRDGSIFYIIIDKGANGENVYFLNSVDIVDLASLINTEDENLSAQEKEILNGANAVTGSYNYAENVPDEENGGNGADRNNNTNNNFGNTKAPTQGNNNTLYLVLGIGAVVAIGIGWYFKVGPGKKKNVGFDEEDDEDEEEEYYEEEVEEYTAAPVEETYDEEEI